jgi:hypothetical protein
VSYDVHLEILDAESGQPVRVGNLDANHTYNTAKMIKEASGSDKFMSDWDGMRASEVAALCVRAIRALDDLPTYYRSMEPDNKWGSLETTRRFLATIRDECVLAPTATFRVG